MRWIACADTGRTHWGPLGAAGLLITAPGAYDEQGRASRLVLLEKRAAWVDCGGTYGIPGGAIHRGEAALDAAFREAREELSGLDDLVVLHTRHRRVVGAHVATCPDCEAWAYTTVVLDAPEALRVAPRSSETVAASWGEPSQVAALPLHPGFAAAWPDLLRILAAAWPAHEADLAGVCTGASE